MFIVVLVISIWIIAGLILAFTILGKEELSEEDRKLKRQIIKCVVVIFMVGITITIVLIAVFNIRFPAPVRIPRLLVP